ncbi:MAG TPA: 23S rRNA (uracil(1939)-C(5))-methyltransferase RlmD, partial [Desulfobacteria bacterium]|nr:23S rRNA (uracil(1939)-C(5))-methyltransferase RlmD [Desulfobacteria bacterium]
MTRETVVNPGDEVELSIEAINHNGDGVGRFKGLTVFVPQTVPGEKVLTKITALKKNFALGKAEEITERSGQRVEPSCEAAATCGGSRLQHIDYSFQLELKQRIVENSLARIGKISDVVVHPTLGMENPWAYRNKAHFQVSQADNRVRLGFFEEGSHELASTCNCLLLDKEITETASLVEEMLNEYKVPAYDWKTGKGLLRHVVIRKGVHNGQIMVVLVTSSEKFDQELIFAGWLKTKMPKVAAVIRNINTGQSRQVFGKTSKLLVGEK